MAKDYIRTKNYITKFIEMKTHLSAVSLKIQVRLTTIREVQKDTYGFIIVCEYLDCEVASSYGRCYERCHNSFDKNE